jgi:hypothetical protein
LNDVLVSDFCHDAIMIADIDKESRKYAVAFYVVQYAEYKGYNITTRAERNRFEDSD